MIVVISRNTFYNFIVSDNIVEVPSLNSLNPSILTYKGPEKFLTIYFFQGVKQMYRKIKIQVPLCIFLSYFVDLFFYLTILLIIPATPL